MHGHPERIEQFRSEIAELHIKDPSAPRDPLVSRIGLALLVVGMALPAVAYALSHGTTNPLQQRDAIIVALGGVALTVAGGALHLKAALGNLLRFWLLRDLHERRAQTDRVIAALAGKEDAPPGANPPTSGAAPSTRTEVEDTG